MVKKRSVYQHWDPLKICIVGRSYQPEFYSYIDNPRVRSVLERIAIETEEDYQVLIKVLQTLGVEVWRPTMYDSRELYRRPDVLDRYKQPPMTPRDWGGMFGETFYWHKHMLFGYADILDNIGKTNKLVLTDLEINTAMITRVGVDLYVGTLARDDHRELIASQYSSMAAAFPGYRTHMIDTEGHTDGVFCPVKPGLIISLDDIQLYDQTFPDWEVITLPNQSWDLVEPFLGLKRKNYGKWWVQGEELNDDFTDFVEQWLSHWVGYVEETVFDVNMLVVDQQNVICNNYNKQVFDAFDRHGITAHVVNFRHRYFWDGGIHCITQDVHREGVMQDWFPHRQVNIA